MGKNDKARKARQAENYSKLSRREMLLFMGFGLASIVFASFMDSCSADEVTDEKAPAESAETP